MSQSAAATLTPRKWTAHIKGWSTWAAKQEDLPREQLQLCDGPLPVVDVYDRLAIQLIIVLEFDLHDL